jgi:hypothetical protein
VVAGTWGVAAGWFCRQSLGERERTLSSILFTVQKTYEEKLPKVVKMTKNILKSQKIYQKITPKPEKLPKTYN